MSALLVSTCENKLDIVLIVMATQLLLLIIDISLTGAIWVPQWIKAGLKLNLVIASGHHRIVHDKVTNHLLLSLLLLLSPCLLNTEKRRIICNSSSEGKAAANPLRCWYKQQKFHCKNVIFESLFAITKLSRPLLE